jgi:rhs-family protein (fragment)
LCSLITQFPRLLPRRLLGTTIIEGKAAPQGLGLPGGQTQKYINDLERLIRQ